MKILVSNIGSTSFKFRVFDFGQGQERELCAGGVDRIGGAGGMLSFCPTGGQETKQPCACSDHGLAIEHCLELMVQTGVLAAASDLTAVAFKAVMAGDVDSVRRVDDELIGAMEYFVPVAPAHNPAYISAMRSFRARLGEGIALVAAFEPGFHRTVAAHRRCYAVPTAWQAKLGVQRYGFHGASHRYIAQRTAELMPEAKRIISVHLGGSSSVCAIREGRSVATSMGFSPQSGLPQTNRVGDFDPFALLLVQRETGKNLEQMLGELSNAGGLEAMSGVAGGDMRDIEEGYVKGDERCVLTFQAFSTAVRDYVGAYLVELGGADAIVFTGGVGQKSPLMRGLICRGLEFAGIVLDDEKNNAMRKEGRVDAASSRIAIWAMPTNEELVVARQAKAFLEGS